VDTRLELTGLRVILTALNVTPPTRGCEQPSVAMRALEHSGDGVRANISPASATHSTTSARSANGQSAACVLLCAHGTDRPFY